jgi:secreted trypsin-like serine protease
MRTLVTLAVAIAAAVPLSGIAAGSAPPVARAANPTDTLVPSEAGTSIVNGQPATVSEFPSIIAGLRVGSSRPQGQSCTGAVVAARKVLTAAHCMVDVGGEKSYVYGRNDVADTSTGFRTQVVEFKTHPNYSGVGGWQTGWDVAIVTTADDLPVQPSQFARIAGSSDTALTAPGRTGIPVGYGMKRPGDNTDGRLMKSSFPINDPGSCNVFNIPVRPETMVCAGFNDGRTAICSGDSGGPLFVDGVVVGVASWGGSQCERYSIYGRLTNEMGDWAKSQLGQQPPGEFTLGVTPSSVRVNQGGFISTTVTSTAGEGGQESIELSASGLPSGAAAVFQPASINTGDTAKLTITTATSTPSGTFPVTISGTGASGTETATLTLTVGDGQQPGDLKVSADPASASVFRGGSAFSTIRVTGATARITLSATGAPAGARVQFLPASFNPGGTSTMFVTTGFTTPPGTYKITITASSSGRSGSAEFTLTVTR